VKIERPEETRGRKIAESREHRVKTARGQVARAGRKRTKRKIHCKLLGDSVDVSLLVGKIGIMAKEVPKR